LVYCGKPNFSDGSVAGFLVLRDKGWQTTEKIRLPVGRSPDIGSIVTAG
jgi:hypothetical protein